MTVQDCWIAYGPGSEGAMVGFGQATFEMRRLLHEVGLEVSNENNQYADHAGIKLLYASVLCRNCTKAADAGDEADEAAAAASLDEYVSGCLLAWIPKLQDAVDAAVPDGYVSHLLVLAIAMLRSL